MSQRIPSHCPAMSDRVRTVAARRAGENASSCTTSGHGGKYGSRPWARMCPAARRSEEHTSELQSQSNLVCRLLLEKKKKRTASAHARDQQLTSDTLRSLD